MSNKVDNFTDFYSTKAMETMQVAYTIRFPEPHTHYLQVEVQISNCTLPEIRLKMPVWTPGSYLVREFARHIDLVECELEDRTFQRVEKTNKNTWLLKTQNRTELKLRYAVYCFDWSVRTNFIDEDHAFLNGAPTFLYVEGQEQSPVLIHIEPHPAWKHISTSLAMIGNDKWTRTASNLDELVDSPFEIGNHDSHFFEAGGIPHEVAIFGSSPADTGKLLSDLKAVIEEEVSLFGSHPCQNYLFIIHHSENSFGGLEHLHGSVNHITRKHYEGKKYQHAISLLAHEYFHLWNVKRIRPAELATYNYDAETYTQLLWFFEGVTSYYDDLCCCRAGIFSRETYLEIVSDNLNRVLNTPGIHIQTLAEASFDTWLKYYRQTENSHNAQISYYTKGGIVAMLFDFLILDATNGKRSLDDVMRSLYNDYIADPSKGITEKSLLKTFNDISGIDFDPYFQKYIHTTARIQPENYFKLLGLQLTDTGNPEQVYMGIHTKNPDGKIQISKLERGFGAYDSGLNVHDEILAIDGIEADEAFKKTFAHKKPGDNISMTISRQGILREITVTLSADTRKKYQLEIPETMSKKHKMLLEKWLASRKPVV